MATIPLTVLTGFLGSGKTTLLNTLLKDPDLADSAVLINEFGAVGLDHHLVEGVLDDAVVLDGGCVCCTVRGALSGALRTLFWQRHDGKLPHFKRVILETTGLANPAPLLQELLEHPAIVQHFHVASVIVCVDAVFGAGQLDEHVEAAQQAAVADRLLITKTDLAGAPERDALLTRLRSINPAADLVLVEQGRPQSSVISDADLFKPHSKKLSDRQWLQAERYRRVEVRPRPGFSNHLPSTRNANRHGADIEAFCLTFERPMEWDALITALEVIAALRGQNLLRMKGIVEIAGSDKPMVVHGVQHMLYPTSTLERWPEGPRESRLVFIVRSTEVDFIAHTFNHFIHARVPEARPADKEEQIA